MSFEMDPSLLQDFLTESAELIERLDADLVKLEAASAAGDPAQVQELCNGCFRALHTIKGAASFLALTAVTTFAHAAEDALNRLRKGEVAVTQHVMDALLQSADVVRSQIEALSAGDAAPDGPQELIDRLHGIASGEASVPAAAAAPHTTPKAEPQDDASTPLNLGPQKLDLVEFMVADLHDYAKQIVAAAGEMANDATRADGAHHLVEVADALGKTLEFFELPDLARAVKAMGEAAAGYGEASAAAIAEPAEALGDLSTLLEEQAKSLANKRVLKQSVEPLIAKMTVGAEAKREDVVAPAPVVQAAAETHEGPAKPQAAKAEAAPKGESSGAVAEQTIRVEVSRLESLLNLVGQLVLNKNRVLALTRALREGDVPHEKAEEYAAAAGDYDRLMSELQVGVMRTRMQPLAKLFDRYPRVIRDLARATDKQIRLEIEGKDTEVDKSVLEQLSDPLVHILRNSADHGCETAEARVAAGKPAEGCIRLTAEHQGSHVRVAITDDGKGLDRDRIGAKAIERGMITADALAQMSDADVFRFIFEAGFSTAEKVSDLSGRGVGMDVVRTNIAKVNGTINIESQKGKGTTIEILIPLTVAIMPAMVVGVGKHLYSIPLQSIVEIVRPEESGVHKIAGQSVMKLRDTVLPLVDLRHRLNELTIDGGGKFAVVVAVGGQRAGLVVDRLVGQQEIVIKPLDDGYTQGGPFSGATIREDGEVSLILDVVQLLRSNNPNAATAATKKAA